MIEAIEDVIIIPPDGKLPETFRAAFGRKAQVIVLLPEETAHLHGETNLLNELKGKIGLGHRSSHRACSWVGYN